MEANLFSYGSDQSGLICGYVFDGTAAGRPITTELSLDWLRDRDRHPEGSGVPSASVAQVWRRPFRVSLGSP